MEQRIGTKAKKQVSNGESEEMRRHEKETATMRTQKCKWLCQSFLHMFSSKIHFK